MKSLLKVFDSGINNKNPDDQFKDVLVLWHSKETGKYGIIGVYKPESASHLVEVLRKHGNPAKEYLTRVLTPKPDQPS